MNKKEKEIILDARGQVFGRFASKVAYILMNKNQPDYKENVPAKAKIEVINASKIIFTGKKLAQKKYFHFSGFAGGIRVKKLSEHMEKDPSRILRQAVSHMMPKNRLRGLRLKRLIIKN